MSAARTSGGPRLETISYRVERYGETVGKMNFDELAEEYLDLQLQHQDAASRLQIAEGLLNRALLIVAGTGPIVRV